MSDRELALRAPRSGARQTGSRARRPLVSARDAACTAPAILRAPWPIPPAASRAAFDLPPSFGDARGRTRRVGIEVEFTGLSARTAARTLGAALGGTVVEEDAHAFLVRGTWLGDLAVELDLRYAHPRRAYGKTLPVRLGPRAAAWLGSAVSCVVPRELITAPMPAAGLAGVDRAVDLLRRAGATGHGTTWLGSLGLHFNVDPPRLDAEVITTFLKAFLLLEPWLRREGARDGARRRPPFLPAPFPTDYVRRVVAPGYRPDLASFADDYLAANPTRHRALDLLPILLHFDEARVRARLPREKIAARPVLHYRLPLARVGEPGWSIAPAWNGWAAVERLAGDLDQLGALGRAYLAVA
jgi:hypothetical protein